MYVYSMLYSYTIYSIALNGLGFICLHAWEYIYFPVSASLSGIYIDYVRMYVCSVAIDSAVAHMCT